MNSTFYRSLHSADRMVVLGDGLALAGNRPYGFLTLLREAVGLEELTWAPVGRSNDRWPLAPQRFVEEVQPLRATVLIVMLGLNDVWHQSRGQVLEFGETRRAVQTLAQQYFQANPTGDLVLCSPLLIGEKSDGSNSLDRDLAAVAQLIDDVSREILPAAAELPAAAGPVVAGSPATGPTVTFLDTRRRALEYLQQHNPHHKPHSILTVDGIQLNKVGHQFLAGVVADFFSFQLPTPTAEALRHVVFLKFKPDASAGQIREVLQAFQGLGKRIEQIAAIESGVNNSPEGLSDGLTHAFTLTFRSATDRDLYLHHPHHQEFVQLALPAMERVCVLDYWAQSHPTVQQSLGPPNPGHPGPG